MKEQEIIKKLEELENLTKEFIKVCKDNKLHKQAIFKKKIKSYLTIRKIALVSKKKIIKGKIDLSDFNFDMAEDKVCYRFRIWDTGKPVKTSDGRWKINRTIFFDPSCAETLIPHNNIHGQMNDKGTITKVKDAEYDTFQGKSIWRSNQVKKDLEDKGGGETTFEVFWEPKKKVKTPPKLNETFLSKDNCEYEKGQTIRYETGTLLNGYGNGRNLKIDTTPQSIKLRKDLIELLEDCPEITKITFSIKINDPKYIWDHKDAEAYFKELFEDLKNRGIKQNLQIGDIDLIRSIDAMAGEVLNQFLKFD